MTALTVVNRLLEVAVRSSQEDRPSSLPMPDVPNWPEVTQSDGDFRRLVSAVYVWLRELWPEHLNFLLRAAQIVALPAADVRGLRADVDALRTSQQHALDPLNPQDARTAQIAVIWFARACGEGLPTTVEAWSRCGETLLAQAAAAVRQLIAIIRAVGNDGALHAQWTRVFSASDELDLVDIRRGFASDLGLSLRTRDADYLDRQIERRWRSLLTRHSTTDPPALARSVVLRELAAWSMLELPLDLDDLLDRLDIAPGRQALGAVRLAHAVWESVSFDDMDEFVDVLGIAWNWLMEQ